MIVRVKKKFVSHRRLRAFTLATRPFVRTLRALCNVEPYLYPIAIVPILVPNPYRAYQVAVLIAFVLLRRHTLGCFVRRTPLDLPIAITLTGVTFGAIVSPVWDVSVERLWGYLASLAWFYLIVTRRSESHVRSYIGTFVGGSLLTLVTFYAIGILQPNAMSEIRPVLGEVGRLLPRRVFGGAALVLEESGDIFPQLASIPTSGNFIALLFLYAVPFLIAVALRSNGVRRYSWLLLAAGMGAGIVLSGSRGGSIALAAGGLGVLAAYWRRSWLALWLLAIPVAVLAFGWVGPQTALWLNLPDPNLIGRLELWNTSFKMIRDVPFTGVGLGAWRAVLPLYSANVYPAHPHNTILQIYLDSGPLGLIGTVWFVAWSLRQAFRQQQDESWLSSWLRIGVAGAWLAWIVQGSFDATSAWAWNDQSVKGLPVHSVLSPIPWFLAALSVIVASGLGSMRRRQESSSVSEPTTGEVASASGR